MATQPMRFFAAEFIREAAFETLHEELPYSVAVEIDEFREGAEPGIYSGRRCTSSATARKGSSSARAAAPSSRSGAAARAKIESLLGERVFLELARQSASQVAPRRTVAQASGVRRMSLAPDLLEILVCPKCKGPLEHRTDPREELVVPRLPPDLRGRGRHSHHADR